MRKILHPAPVEGCGGHPDCIIGGGPGCVCGPGGIFLLGCGIRGLAGYAQEGGYAPGAKVARCDIRVGVPLPGVQRALERIKAL